MKRIRHIIIPVIISILVLCFLTSCVSYLGPQHVAIKGFGDDRYIDYGGTRYYCKPELSRISGGWHSKDSDAVYIGNTKEWFYKWYIVSDMYFFDYGAGLSYIHCGVYYYFPEGIDSFPPLDAKYVDALLIGDTEITDRKIIEDFMALQEEEGESNDLDVVRHYGTQDGVYESITAYNKGFGVIQQYGLEYDEDGGCWIFVYEPGNKLTKIPDELYERIIALVDSD